MIFDWISPLLGIAEMVRGMEDLEAGAIAPDMRGYEVVRILHANGIKTGVLTRENGSTHMNVSDRKAAERILKEQRRKLR